MDMLDRLGLDYIEGGYPGANPTDTALFSESHRLKAKFTSSNDKTGRALCIERYRAPATLEAKSSASVLSPRSWDYHVRRGPGLHQ